MPSYDTTQLVKDPQGMIKTGEYSSVDPSSLSDAGFQDASSYASSQTTKPLATITTENAASSLDKSLQRLNTYSPSTAPDYTPPVTKNKSAVAVPKAYFTNSNSQEAEYTQDQLNDPTTQKFLTDNGYAMTKTEGPTLEAGSLSSTDRQLSDLFTKFQNYNVDADPGFTAEANSIRSQYDELRTEVTKQREQFGSDFNTLAIREGVGRYTPGRAVDIRSGILTESTNALGNILRKEQGAISDARKAYASGKFTEFNTQMNLLEKIRDDKAQTLTTINKNIQDALDETRKDTKRMTMESDISTLLTEGYTDPQKINEALGFKYATKDVAETLKNISPGNDLDKLPAETREFYILKDKGQLPPGIINLPENKQLFAYLGQKAAATRAPKEGSNNPFTLAEIISLRKQGIDVPLSLVGEDQNSFNKTLTQENPPQWFIEKAEKEHQMSLTPESAKEAWKIYQDTEINKVGISEDKSNDFKKARAYFTSTYEGLDDTQLDSIASQVETYVNGGMSYADAITQTKKDLK